MSARTAARKQPRRQRKLEVGESRVEWVEADSSASRSASARVSKFARLADDYDVGEADVEIEAFVKRGKVTVDADTEVFIQCSVSTVGNVNRKVTIQDAKLSDLPLIALALQGALTVGVRDGSFPALPGVPVK